MEHVFVVVSYYGTGHGDNSHVICVMEKMQDAVDCLNGILSVHKQKMHSNDHGFGLFKIQINKLNGLFDNQTFDTFWHKTCLFFLRFKRDGNKTKNKIHSFEIEVNSNLMRANKIYFKFNKDSEKVEIVYENG